MWPNAYVPDLHSPTRENTNLERHVLKRNSNKIKVTLNTSDADSSASRVYLCINDTPPLAQSPSAPLVAIVAVERLPPFHVKIGPHPLTTVCRGRSTTLSDHWK